MPLDAPGVKIERMLSVYGYDHAPHGHGEVSLTDVRVPVENLLLGEGRGFEIAQGRLGPGRIHHCMRTIGVAEIGIEAMAKRLLTRVAFGKRIADHSIWEKRVAQRADRYRDDAAAVPEGRRHDGQRGQQVGATGNRDDQGRRRPTWRCRSSTMRSRRMAAAACRAISTLARAWASMRTLRFADGPGRGPQPRDRAQRVRQICRRMRRRRCRRQSDAVRR